MPCRTLLCLMMVIASARAEPGSVIDAMDQNEFRVPQEKGQAETVAGKVGQAVRFSFEKDCQSKFFIKNLRDRSGWDEADGFSFWVKGDGSNHFGGLQFIYNENYGVRYDFMFPISEMEWQKITVRWSDLVPVMPGAESVPLGAGGNAPSKLSSLWFGKWWYWRDYAAHAYAIDDIRLERDLGPAPEAPRPSGDPLARVRAKLAAGEPITVVTMGDSLTDFNHWANRQTNWPTLLSGKIESAHRAKVTLNNPAIGGTQLRQGMVLIPRWVQQAPAPDLVTICYGYNDWSAGMRGEQFYKTLLDAVDRVRRATKGRSDVLLLTTAPALERWDTMAELADAVRRAAKEKNAGLADIEKTFHAVGPTWRSALYVRDKVHLGPAGHQAVAETVYGVIAPKR